MQITGISSLNTFFSSPVASVTNNTITAGDNTTEHCKLFSNLANTTEILRFILIIYQFSHPNYKHINQYDFFISSQSVRI